MLPSDTRLPVSTRLDSPPWTNPTSTSEFGTLRRFKLSSEPSDGRILSVTPLRASILRYCSAWVQSVVPSGPLAIVMVLGGAGRTK